MSDILKVIKERRSIRKFQSKPVSDELLNTILEAGRWAPSWANTQCWKVVIVRDESIKLQLQQTLSEKNPAYKAIAEAPVVLALCGKKCLSGYYKGEVCTHFGDWMLFDLGMFAQNVALCAHSLGLGTVIVSLLDHKKAGEILNVPEDYELVSLIPLGFPDQIPTPPPRKEIKEFVSYQKFE